MFVHDVRQSNHRFTKLWQWRLVTTVITIIWQGCVFAIKLWGLLVNFYINSLFLVNNTHFFMLGWSSGISVPSFVRNRSGLNSQGSVQNLSSWWIPNKFENIWNENWLFSDKSSKELILSSKEMCPLSSIFFPESRRTYIWYQYWDRSRINWKSLQFTWKIFH